MPQRHASFTRSALEDVAALPVFERGRGYVSRVTRLDVSGQSASAWIRGTEL
ncbi:MAG TPA: hypothetical protein GX743_05515, partial [Actinomycetales bacterium]|nr:hypothetical protein [Actinomycetales bacterium]